VGSLNSLVLFLWCSGHLPDSTSSGQFGWRQGRSAGTGWTHPNQAVVYGLVAELALSGCVLGKWPQVPDQFRDWTQLSFQLLLPPLPLGQSSVCLVFLLKFCPSSWSELWVLIKEATHYIGLSCLWKCFPHLPGRSPIT